MARVTSTEMKVRDGQIRRELLHCGHDLVPHDRVLRAVILELLTQFARGYREGWLDDDSAETEYRVEGHDVLGAVR